MKGNKIKKVDNGTLIISASIDKTIVFWDRNWMIRKIHHGNSEYWKLQELQKSGNIVAGKHNGEIEIFDKITGESKFVVQAHSHTIFALTELDSEQFVSGSEDGFLRLWNSNLSPSQTPIEFKGHTSGITCVKQHSSGVILSGSWDKTIRVWHPSNGKLLQTLSHEIHITEIQELTHRRILSICGKFVGAAAKAMKIWDLVSGAGIYTAPTSQAEPHGFRSSYLPDQQLVILGGIKGNLETFHLENKLFIQSYQLHTGVITQIQPLNSQQILTSSSDTTMKISNWGSGEVIRTIQQHAKYVVDILIVEGENED